MITAHYINPFIEGQYCEFELLLTEDGNALSRSHKRFLDTTTTEEAFESMLLSEAQRSLNCIQQEQYNESLLSDLEAAYVAKQVDELLIDWPTRPYQPELISVPLPTPSGFFVTLWRKFWSS